MSRDFLSPAYGGNTLTDNNVDAGFGPAPEEDPVMARVTALESRVAAMEEAMRAQGMEVFPARVDPWRERARRRLPPSSYEGELPY